MLVIDGLLLSSQMFLMVLLITAIGIGKKILKLNSARAFEKIDKKAKDLYIKRLEDDMVEAQNEIANVLVKPKEEGGW